MVTSKRVLDIIKNIIEKRYASLAVSVLGYEALTAEERKKLRSLGVQVPEKPSLLELAYFHNLLIPHGVQGPSSVQDMEIHQSGPGIRPKKEEFEYAKQHANEAMKIALEKMKQDSLTRILNLVQENNQNYKFNAAKNGDQTKEVQKLIKESTISKLKQKLRDSSGDTNRDWNRIAVTEVSNVIGVGSTDRILSQNENKSPDEIYVYRIVVNDPALCKYCRKFYLDSDGTPKLYRLSTLLGNGSNYGKKAVDWAPVVGATHPHERCSQVIELKRGWKLLSGGHQTYMGSKGWDEYIVNKLST